MSEKKKNDQTVRDRASAHAMSTERFETKDNKSMRRANFRYDPLASLAIRYFKGPSTLEDSTVMTRVSGQWFLLSLDTRIRHPMAKICPRDETIAQPTRISAACSNLLCTDVLLRQLILWQMVLSSLLLFRKHIRIKAALVGLAGIKRRRVSPNMHSHLQARAGRVCSKMVFSEMKGIFMFPGWEDFWPEPCFRSNSL